MSELAIGLVGCGRLARAGYLPALIAARGVRLAAVADPDPLRRETVVAVAGDAAAGRRVPAFRTLEGLLQGARVDAVVLATPVAAHLDDAQLAANAGVATLVEKPPAPDAAGAAALAALGPAPWVAFNRRFGAGQRAVRAALAGREDSDHGSGGERAPGSARPQRVDLMLELRYRRASWGAHTVGDEALLDLGPHLVDLARWLSGDEVAGVRAASLSHERAELELDLERGRATLRCAADRPHRELIEARGEDGHLLARHSEGGLVAGLCGRLARRGEPHPLVASLTAQLESFARAARGEPEPALATAADGHAVMAVLDAARACAAGGGRPVELAVAA